MGISAFSITVPVTPIAPSEIQAGAIGEGHIVIIPALSGTVVQGTWTNQVGANNSLNIQHINSGMAINDEEDYKIYLAGGTYSLAISGETSNDRGIITFKLDATTIGTIDQYSASLVWNVKKTITGIAVATAGLYTLKAIVATKNGSSSNYGCSMSIIELWRTA